LTSHTHTLFSHYPFFFCYVDTQVVIGAYEYFSNTYGGQTRDCIIYIEESNFKCRTEVGEGSECNQSDIFNESPFRNDYALCKLNLPVYVDDTKVKLELNTNKKFPSNGDDVVAIGFGTTSLGGSQPQFLQDVTIKVKSNKQCRKVDNALYNSNSIGPESICASVPNGGKDSCQGDSGGRKFFRYNFRVSKIYVPSVFFSFFLTYVRLLSFSLSLPVRTYLTITYNYAYDYDYDSDSDSESKSDSTIEKTNAKIH
jgi:hypothetical protein